MATPQLTVSTRPTFDADGGYVQALDAPAQVLGDQQRSRHFGRRQNDGELLAAITRDRVATAHQTVGEAERHRLQAIVADQMSVGVVVPLETVDVDKSPARAANPPAGIAATPPRTGRRTGVGSAPRSQGVDVGEVDQQLVGPRAAGGCASPTSSSSACSRRWWARERARATRRTARATAQRTKELRPPRLPRRRTDHEGDLLGTGDIPRGVPTPDAKDIAPGGERSDLAARRRRPGRRSRRRNRPAACDSG